MGCQTQSDNVVETGSLVDPEAIHAGIFLIVPVVNEFKQQFHLMGLDQWEHSRQTVDPTNAADLRSDASVSCQCSAG